LSAAFISIYVVNTLHAKRIRYSFGRASSIARDGHLDQNAHKYIILFIDYYIIYYYKQFTIIYFVFNLLRSTYIDNRLRSNSKHDIPVRFRAYILIKWPRTFLLCYYSINKLIVLNVLGTPNFVPRGSYLDKARILLWDITARLKFCQNDYTLSRDVDTTHNLC